MNRAEQFGIRLLKVQGGATKPIYLVLTNTIGRDYSRGVEGTVSTNEIELLPRPSIRSVRSGFITRNGVSLKEGDIEIDISNKQITEYILKDLGTKLRRDSKANSGELLKIVDYTELDYMKNTVYWRIYARGIVGP